MAQWYVASQVLIACIEGLQHTQVAAHSREKAVSVEKIIVQGKAFVELWHIQKVQFLLEQVVLEPGGGMKGVLMLLEQKKVVGTYFVAKVGPNLEAPQEVFGQGLPEKKWEIVVRGTAGNNLMQVDLVVVLVLA